MLLKRAEGLGYWEQRTASMQATVFSRISALLIICFLVSCENKRKVSSLPYYNAPDFTPIFITKQKEVSDKIDHTIKNFSFTDQHGKQFNDAEIAGKVHVANFIFTGCGSICPVMTSHMKLVQEAFKNNADVVMLSFSVTPWYDDVDRLNAYAKDNQITASNWHLLTGNKRSIYVLARQSYFAEEDLGFTKDSTEFLHTEHVLLVDKTKRIRGVYNGTLQLEIEQMIRDIHELLAE